MRKPLIAGNWKMNLLHSKVPGYFEALQKGLEKADRSKADVLLAVPAPFLGIAKEFGHRSHVHIAAQTIHDRDDGAFTGEISLPMLKDLGIGWALIGHSERRQYYNETDATVAAKTKAAIAQGVHPIVCIGETRGEREGGLTEEVLKRQLNVVLTEIGKTNQFTIAYEPVWAIGTGLTATDDQAQSAHAYIRALLNERLGGISNELRILYGGSVKSSNIHGLMQQPDVDGALVGGASLDPQEFAKIVTSI